MKTTTQTRYKMVGSKYAEGRSAKEIASLVRGEIRAAVKAGELPSAKYSVRIDGSNMHSSISIGVSGLGFATVRQTLSFEDRLANGFRTPAAQFVCDRLETMLAAYNFDNSDTMTDYFHVNFYGSVDLESVLETAMQEDARLEARNAAERAEMLGDELADLDNALPAPSCVAATGW